MRVVERLSDRRAALSAIHYGERPSDAEAGRRRLAFDELLFAQLMFLRRRARRAAGASAAPLDGARTLTARWLERALPFSLTGDQSAAVAELERDLAATRPMQRLLLGDVGSGKTVIALFAMLRAVEHGMQAALMAPTETLAEQHFGTVQRLLGEETVTAGLLTGATPGRRRADVLGKLASGELGLVVGTHALVEADVRFRALAVAVVDEQHRFGVRQRAALDAKAPAGLAPHVLHLTATPIPRTLALLNYGDLDQTILRELPRGRQPVATHIASGARERSRAYERIREELRRGRQAFVVCPLVEESEQLQARAATVEYERLAQTEFRDFRVVLLHGQMRPRAKQEAMAAFAAGAADVLVATSVIEVGIDVPNATVMLVENAERYGISQLHQLRGRVGRGTHPSVCVLFGPGHAPRVRALAEHQDGFRLAQLDLELRKEGDLIGTRQSGLSDFGVARMPEDLDLLERARRQAEAIAIADPELRTPGHALLAEALERRYGPEALEPIPA
jgi:ATP-dependent DNA helicase RecG